MARLPREDRSSVKDVVLTLKLSRAERALLDRLAADRAEELARLTGERTPVTVARYLRWLMMRDAEARGMSLNEVPAEGTEIPPPTRPRDESTDVGRSRPAQRTSQGPVERGRPKSSKGRPR